VAAVSSLSGFVFVDANYDGVRDPATEWVLPNIEITLSKLGEPQPAYSTTTDFDGKYAFSGLDRGTYTLAQPGIPPGYLSAVARVGELVDPITSDPLSDFPGYTVNYDQRNSIPSQVAGIEIPETGAVGSGYDFGQVWTGKAWLLTTGGPPGDPPGGHPPVGIPEPSALGLLVLGLISAGLSRFRMA